jgi:hypothetical protein
MVYLWREKLEAIPEQILNIVQATLHLTQLAKRGWGGGLKSSTVAVGRVQGAAKCAQNEKKLFSARNTVFRPNIRK